MEWKDNYLLNIPRMDDTHREFADHVRRLFEASDGHVVAALEELIAHTDAHFAQENRWMEASAFPPIHCHTDEHARVLESLRKIRDMAEKNPGLGKIVARELESWFIQHSATMDAALAGHMRRVDYSPT